MGQVPISTWLSGQPTPAGLLWKPYSPQTPWGKGAQDQAGLGGAQFLAVQHSSPSGFVPILLPASLSLCPLLLRFTTAALWDPELLFSGGLKLPSHFP